MSIDRSLKTKGSLSRHRNVLTRTERIQQLKDEERFSEGESLLGLPKVAHRKSHAGKKKLSAEEKAASEEAAPGEATKTESKTQ